MIYVRQTTGVASTLRVRKGASNDAAEQSLREACSQGGVHACCAGSEGMIRHSISLVVQHGVSQWKNCDAQSLGSALQRVVGVLGLLVEQWMPSAPLLRTLPVLYLLKGGEVLTTRIDPLSVSEKAELRSRTVSTKVTEAEFAELESSAFRGSQNVGQWIRHTLLNEARSERASAMSLHLFTELVGIQLLLMNTLGPILRGERVTAEQLEALLRQVQSTKARKAQELLTKRQITEQRTV